jgi:GH35 family endo-1,4-beta-xylanase
MKTEILNKTFYDCRLEDYFTVANDVDNDDNFVYIEYKKKTHRNKREAVSFIIYHIGAKQYLPKTA